MRYIYLCCILVNAILSANAQMDSMNLYSGQAPGAVASELPERWIVNPNDGVSLVTEVSQPVLYIHRPKNPNGSSVILFPGGGYFAIAMNHEGHSLARWFNRRGITAFVVKYRLPDERLMTEKWIRPLQDAQQAMRVVRGNATKWKIDPNRIGVMGFSAGGHLAATVGTHFQQQVGEITNASISVRPDFMILVYPLTSFRYDTSTAGIKTRFFGSNPSEALIDQFSNDRLVTAQTPPTFLVLSADDFLNPDNSINFFRALHKNKVPAELHIYEKGGHGYSLTKKNRGHVEEWDRELEGWLKDRKLIR